MFRNNPQVPEGLLKKQTDTQIVNKNKTSLFSTSNYKDLTDLHAHMVSNNSFFRNHNEVVLFEMMYFVTNISVLLLQIYKFLFCRK